MLKPNDSTIYSFDPPVPLPPDPKVLAVPTEDVDPEQIRLSYGYGESGGGYKVPSLIGLFWTAPYLHDGSVAVGTDLEKHVGLPGTLLQGILPDPINSLKAIVDRDLRARVIAANHRVTDLQDVHVQGLGHEHWVDEAHGFTRDDQNALVHYLLTVPGDPSEVAAVEQIAAHVAQQKKGPEGER
jgi:hypothetical protein